MLGERLEIVVALDWTDFDKDDQSTLVLSLCTAHGPATPLLCKTVKKSQLQKRRNDYEDALLHRLCEVIPDGVRVTVLCDRGFADKKLYEFLKTELGSTTSSAFARASQSPMKKGRAARPRSGFLRARARSSYAVRG